MGTTLPLLKLWREYADDVRGRAIERCGHFVPEERPGEVVDELRAFLAEAG
jgi:pimeloyl-ACP methyl ester carboxylesterase